LLRRTRPARLPYTTLFRSLEGEDQGIHASTSHESAPGTWCRIPGFLPRGAAAERGRAGGAGRGRERSEPGWLLTCENGSPRAVARHVPGYGERGARYIPLTTPSSAPRDTKDRRCRGPT